MGTFEESRAERGAVDGTEVIITGSGIPTINPKRAGSGVLVRRGDTVLHFDAGRGTATRVVESGIDVSALTAMFLTHYHSDHLVGLDDFLLGRWIEDDYAQNDQLAVFAPTGKTHEFCERLIDLWRDDLVVRAEHNGRSPDLCVDLRSFEVTPTLTELWSENDVRVLASEVRHEPVIGAVGYRVETPEGVIAITGDTIVCPEVEVLAEGADVVVYEALRSPLVREMPKELHFICDYHADTVEIGEQMARLSVPHLLLTHLIPPPDTDDEKQGFIDDVRIGGYEGDVMVCDDLDAIVLPPK